MLEDNRSEAHDVPAAAAVVVVVVVVCVLLATWGGTNKSKKYVSQTDRELATTDETHHRRTVVHPFHVLPFLLAGQAQFQLFLPPRLGMGQLGLLPLLPLWCFGSMVNGC